MSRLSQIGEIMPRKKYCTQLPKNGLGSSFCGKMNSRNTEKQGKAFVLSGHPAVKKISNGGRRCYKSKWMLCLLARTRWKLQKKKQFFSREVVPDFHWMRIVYIYTWRNVYAKIWKLWIGKAKGAIFIGPRSDHSLPMSLTDWLTDDLDEDLMNWPLLLESNI